ncbi:transcriptional regulator [Micromonospora echinofusca]|uniref:transcriptional regulator n=1 Tax=Micromonospora echinofusca TaxID=47858 RepID=UPI0033E06710
MALRGGARFTVPFEAVFPHGAVFVPDSIAEAQDFNEATRQRTPAKDKVTGERVWQCRVMDMDPELGSRSREVSIKILSNVQPVSPVGPFQQVEFENLTVTPYVGSNGRLAYSFRATGIVAPKTLAETRGKAA